MTERPILFSGPMVRAILEGRKTQTRRVVKLPRGIVSLYRPFPNEPQNVQGVDQDGLIGWYAVPSACPYGVPGDRLWVRESFARSDFGKNGYLYRADGELKVISWSPSIHLPRAACRLVLEVTDVRVQRLQEISDADARAEGCETNVVCPDVRANYRAVWDSLNAKRAPWTSNPWVWVVEFRRVS